MEEIVMYEVAAKLKEKGFNQKTRGGYLPPFTGLHIAFVEKDWIKVNGYPAPTIAQAMKWLREEKKIHIAVDIMKAYPAGNIIYWGYNIVLIDKYEVYHSDWNSESYESAALAGIEYVLDNLI